MTSTRNSEIVTSKSKHLSLWLLAVCALLILLIGLTWSLNGDDYVRRQLIRQLILIVEESTDYRLEIDGTFKVSISLHPTVSASAVTLYPKQQPDPLLQIGRLELKLTLWPLLLGQMRIERLLIDDVAFDLDSNADSRRQTGSEFSLPDLSTLPILQNVVLRNIRFVRNGPAQASPLEILLSQVTLELSQDGATFLIEGEASVADKSYALSGQIGSLPQLLAPKAPYPVELEILNPALRLSVAGTIDHPLNGEGLKFNLESEAPELSSALALIELDMPPLGRLEANARLEGDIDNASLEEITIRLELPEKLRLEASGTLQGLTSEHKGELQVGGFIKSREVSKWLLPGEMATIDDWQLEGKLTVTGKQIAFRDFNAQGIDKAGLKLSVRGKGVFGDPRQPQPFASLDLVLEIDASNTKSAESLLIESLSEVGPVKGSARLTAPAGDYFAIEDYRVKVGRAKELLATYVGRIGRIPVVGDLPTSEIDMQISVAAARTERLAYALDVSLPEIGPVKYSGRFIGSEKEGIFKHLSLTAGSEKALKIEVSGQLRMGDARTHEPPKSIDVAVTFATPETAPIAKLTGQELPALGPIKGRFQLTGRLQELKVSEIAIESGRPGALTLSATGGIEKLLIEPDFSASGVNLSLTAASPSTEPVFRLFDLDAADLGPLNATGVLVDSDGSLGLEKVKIHVGRPASVDIKISGQLDDLNALDQLDARAEVSAPSLQVVSAIFGQEWRDSSGQVRAAGRLRLEDDKLSYSGNIDVGRTKIETKVSGSFEGSKPRLEGTIESKVLYLADFGFPETKEELKEARLAGTAEIKKEMEKKDSTKGKKAAGERLFSPEPLPWELLNKLDLGLGLAVDQVVGTGAELKALSTKIELKDGQLLMSPAVLDYGEGTLLVDLMLDANDTPRAALQLTADDVAIGAVWGHIQTFVPVSGNINVHLDLSSSGRSPADLAASLNGVVGIASENLKVPYYTADLLAANVLGWVVKRTIASDATVLVRCSIAQLELEQGQVVIQKLMFDGPSMTVTGEGWVNLGSETIDVSVYPKRKTGIWTEAEPVRLSGSLADPKIGVTVVDKKTAAVAGAAAGVAAGAVAVPMLVLPAVALGALWKMIRTWAPCMSPTLSLGERGYFARTS
jgi:hypothetical protein